MCIVRVARSNPTLEERFRLFERFRVYNRTPPVLCMITVRDECNGKNSDEEPFHSNNSNNGTNQKCEELHLERWKKKKKVKEKEKSIERTNKKTAMRTNSRNVRTRADRGSKVDFRLCMLPPKRRMHAGDSTFTSRSLRIFYFVSLPTKLENSRTVQSENGRSNTI